jgi:hypothetical protein
MQHFVLLTFDLSDGSRAGIAEVRRELIAGKGYRAAADGEIDTIHLPHNCLLLTGGTAGQAISDLQEVCGRLCENGVADLERSFAVEYTIAISLSDSRPSVSEPPV